MSDSTFHERPDSMPVTASRDVDSMPSEPGKRLSPVPAPSVPQPMRRAPVSYQPQEPGWWLGSDGLWYPPETAPGGPPAPGQPVVSSPQKGSQTVVVQVATPPASAGYAPFVTAPPKSRVAAGLLGIFLGVFGVHRFYLGYSGLGVAMLLITLLSLGLLAPVVWVWGFIEGVVILAGGIRTDAYHRPLT